MAPPLDESSTQTAGSDRLVGTPLLPAFRIVFIFIAIVEVLAGTAGNGLLLLFLGTRRSLRARETLVHNLFIASLALTDLLALGYWMVFFVLDLTLGYNPVVSEDHCVVNGFLLAVSATVSVLSLVGISFNRYLHVCHNHLFRTFFTTRRTYLLCLLCWVAGLLVCLPPLFGLGSYCYIPKRHICSFCREGNATYAKIASTIFSSVPLFLISYWNYSIFRYWASNRSTPLSRARAKGKDHDNEDDSKEDNEESDVWQAEARNESRSRAKEEKGDVGWEAGNDSRSLMADGDERGNRTKIHGADILPRKVQRVQLISLILCQDQSSHADDRHKGHGENHEDRTALHEAPEAKNSWKAKDCHCDVCHRPRSKSFADATQHLGGCTQEGNEEGWRRSDHVTDQLGIGERSERSSKCSEGEGDKEEKESTSTWQCSLSQSRRRSSRNLQPEGDKRSAKSGITATTATHESCVTSLRRHQRRRRSREVAFVRSLCVVCFLFFVGFFPYTVINAVDFYWTVSPEVLIFSNLLLFFNSAVNWIVYGVMNPTYRRGYIKLLRGCVKRVARETGTVSVANANLPSTTTQPKMETSEWSETLTTP